MSLVTHKRGSPVSRFRGSDYRDHGEEGAGNISIVQEPEEPYDRERGKNYSLRSWGEEQGRPQTFMVTKQTRHNKRECQ